MPLSIASSPVEIRCKAVLFDMDGILISSLESVERAWRKWAILRGVDPDYTCEMAHGCRALDTFVKLRPDLDPEEELKIVEDSETTDFHDVHPMPGALELLAALPTGRWTVVTSAGDNVARVRLQAAAIPVPQHIVTASNVTQGKPHPAPFLDGAALLGFDPADCVVFEDSASGVRAGKAADCTVVATTFSHPISRSTPPTTCVPGLAGIKVRELPASQGLTLTFVRLQA